MSKRRIGWSKARKEVTCFECSAKVPEGGEIAWDNLKSKVLCPACGEQVGQIMHEPADFAPVLEVLGRIEGLLVQLLNKDEKVEVKLSKPTMTTEESKAKLAKAIAEMEERNGKRSNAIPF